MSEPPVTPPGPPPGLPPGLPPGRPPSGPGGQAPYPWQPPQPPGMSPRGKFWLGVALAVPVLLGCLFLVLLVGTLATSISEDPDTQGILVGAALVAVLAAWVALVAVRRTRMVALGAAAGAAVVTVVLGGACVALIAAVSGTV
jgi:hypothetical protein